MTLTIAAMLFFTAATSAAHVRVHGPAERDLLELRASVASFYRAHGHVASEIDEISSYTLNGTKLLWSMLPAAHLSARAIDGMAMLLARGGSVAFVGEQGRYRYRENNRINIAIAALGGSMRIVNRLLDPAFRTATTADGQIRSHPLTNGINVFRYAAFAPILPGNASVIMTGEQSPNPSSVFMAAESVGGGRIFLVTDQNVWDEVRDFKNNDNGKLFLNLITA
jgi:hypothetical protein